MSPERADVHQTGESSCEHSAPQSTNKPQGSQKDKCTYLQIVKGISLSITNRGVAALHFENL